VRARASCGPRGEGLPIGALADIGGVLTYYLLVALVDRRTNESAIPVSWVALWLIVDALDGRWFRASKRRSRRVIAIRGPLAAVLSGAAFFMVMNTLWGRPSASGRNYAVQFGTWAPGLLALILGRPSSARRRT